MEDKISFVIPCYRSEHTLPVVIKEIEETMAQRPQLEYEIICVSDASPDGVYQIIEKMAIEDTHIRGAELLRNFGQQAARMAGFRMVTGSVVVSVDDDGQIPVNETLKLLDKYSEGYDVVCGNYEHKQHSLFRNVGSYINRIMAEHLVGLPKGLHLTSFLVMSRQVVDAVISFNQPYIYLGGLLARATSSFATVAVTHRQRLEGTSGYNLHKLISHWLDGFTAFSVKPLRIASLLGVALSLGSFLYIVYIIIRRLRYADILVGWSSLIAAIFLIGGVVLMELGMIGEYVGRIYISINTPLQYVIRRTTETKENK